MITMISVRQNPVQSGQFWLEARLQGRGPQSVFAVTRALRGAAKSCSSGSPTQWAGRCWALPRHRVLWMGVFKLMLAAGALPQC